MRAPCRPIAFAALCCTLFCYLSASKSFVPRSRAAVAEQDAREYFAAARHNPAALRAFFQRMPKGGELHNHLSGMPTPDQLLQLAAQSKHYHYYVCAPNQPTADNDPIAYRLIAIAPDDPVPQDNGAAFVPINELLHAENDKQRAQLAAFRHANMIAEDESEPNEIFYRAIFQRRAFVVSNAELEPQLVAAAVRQAHKDRLDYIELQITPFPANPTSSLAEINRATNVTTAREYMTTLINAARAANNELPENEKVEVRFILSFSRTSAKIFVSLPMAFELAAGKDAVAAAIAGINIVGNEYSEDERIGREIAGPENLRDYMVTLHRIYPGVRLSIHAGEGTRWDWHIRDSLLIGAERIGHGTNLMLSPDAIEAEWMRRHQILIEACLTSNHLLLKVPFAEHPFLRYLRAGIPVSLNTDDAGIFATDMTEEFTRAAQYSPDISWDEIKQLARNSLAHAFLPEENKQKLLARWEAEMRAFEEKKDWSKWLAQ
jgi:adenosine deaminase CECR1